jgi:hypothetical protein
MSSDQVEARVILNPAFIERFMAAGTALKSKWMEVSFKVDEIILLIQRRRPMFEIGSLFRPISEKYLRKTVQEIEVVINIIDVLKLNPQIDL